MSVIPPCRRVLQLLLPQQVPATATAYHSCYCPFYCSAPGTMLLLLLILPNASGGSCADGWSQLATALSCYSPCHHHLAPPPPPPPHPTPHPHPLMLPPTCPPPPPLLQQRPWALPLPMIQLAPRPQSSPWIPSPPTPQPPRPPRMPVPCLSWLVWTAVACSSQCYSCCA